MRTARLLPASPSMDYSRGEGVCSQSGCLLLGGGGGAGGLVPGGVWSGGCLLLWGGVYFQGVCLLPRGCLLHGGGGCLPLILVVSAPGGVCFGRCLPLVPEGVGVHIPACNGANTPMWTDRYLRRHTLRKLRLRAVKMVG